MECLERSRYSSYPLKIFLHSPTVIFILDVFFLFSSVLQIREQSRALTAVTWPSSVLGQWARDGPSTKRPSTAWCWSAWALISARWRNSTRASNKNNSSKPGYFTSIQVAGSYWYHDQINFFSLEDEFRKWQKAYEMLVSVLWHFSQDLQWKLKLLNLINPVNSRNNTPVLIFMGQLWLHYTVDTWCSRSVLIGVGSAGV